MDSAAYQHFRSIACSAALLDRFYIPTRYPNGLPDLTPDEIFWEEDAEACIENAGKIIAKASTLIEKCYQRMIYASSLLFQLHGLHVLHGEFLSPVADLH